MHASEGGFAYLPGASRFFSKGIVVLSGHALRRIRLHEAMSMELALGFAADFIHKSGRPLEAFCGCELRIPHRLSREDFADFNRRYLAALQSSGFPTDPINPAARTNVVPLTNPPMEAMLYAFTFAIPFNKDTPDFLISGMPELASEPPRVIAPGDTSPAGLRAKAAFVLNDLRDTVRQLGAEWESATATQIYTRHPLDTLTDLLPNGFTHIAGDPPVVGPGNVLFEFEADIRAITDEASA